MDYDPSIDCPERDPVMNMDSSIVLHFWRARGEHCQPCPGNKTSPDVLEILD